MNVGLHAHRGRVGAWHAAQPNGRGANSPEDSGALARHGMLCAWLGIWLCAGCEGTSAVPNLGARTLIDTTAWELAPGRADLFAAVDVETRAGECDPSGVTHEPYGPDTALEVDTGKCDPLVVVQAIRSPIYRGESVHIRLWHYELLARQEAQAVAAVALGDDVVWSRTTDIPGDAELIKDSALVPQDVEEGTPVYFFLRNHGVNRWGLLDITAEP